MVDKIAIAEFIIEREKTNWSDLEEQFVSTKIPKSCPKCNQTNITPNRNEPEGTIIFFCEYCEERIGTIGLSRQTLLNYLKNLIEEGLIEKIINPQTLRPIYRGTEIGKSKIEDIKLKRRLHELIDTSQNIHETLLEIKKIIEEEKTRT